jgi:Ca2+-binding RTX toxin-like protein
MRKAQITSSSSPPPIHLEPLESRRHLSVSLSNGILRVTGTANSDLLEVMPTPGRIARFGSIDVRENNVLTAQFNLHVTPISKVIMAGLGGNDTQRSTVTLPVVMYGGYGNDRLASGSGNDWLFGEAGNDTAVGGVGNDVLLGGFGNDRLIGAWGNDNVVGQEDNDMLFGSYDALTPVAPPPADQSDYDTLSGNEGNDDLYGGPSADWLYGDAGNDGLFGGVTATDNLSGGTGRDRLLDPGEDVEWDLTSEDARVQLQNGPQTTVTFTGQNGSYTYAAGTWADPEVELTDSAFRVLHDATGTTRLLKRADRSQLSFIRQGQQIAATGGTFSASAWNNNGQIFIVTPGRRTVIHEIGHNWDTEFNAAGWNALSGWTQMNMQGNPNFQMGTGVSNPPWWHLTSAQFASTYSMTNPFEDFAESVAANLMNRGGLSNSYTVVATKNSFIDNMLGALAMNP